MNVLDRSIGFVKPNGWDNVKCRSAEYPDFRTPPCVCPGDPKITNLDTHKKILDMCYDHEKQYTASSMSVPMKKRCGVTTTDAINADNICYCNERTNKAAGRKWKRRAYSTIA